MHGGCTPLHTHTKQQWTKPQIKLIIDVQLSKSIELPFRLSNYWSVISTAILLSEIGCLFCIQRWGSILLGGPRNLRFSITSPLCLFKANQFSFQSSKFTYVISNPPLILFHFILSNHLCGDHRFLSCRKNERASDAWGQLHRLCLGWCVVAEPPAQGQTGAWVSCSSTIALLKQSLVLLVCNCFCLQRAVPRR